MPSQIPYPNHEQCRAVVTELIAHDATNPKDLNSFEKSFIKSNKTRQWFTEAQKEVVRTLGTKYVLKSFP